ncbi:hypothetical protein [Schlesneria paludicola]|uniref:hypothetical protein n=1 Tax=Schlesneria paludicola TaxID=360056 RepID=UPI00029B35E8|nr:hypothetical protein [Schlesneria paludicola]
MQRDEFLKLIGSKSDGTEYIPVACLLKNGYACAGYVNQSINEPFNDTCLLINARMVDLREPSRRTERGAIHDFGDFLEEFVTGMMDKTPHDRDPLEDASGGAHERFGKCIPLTAVSFDEIAVVYPVARIGNLLRQVTVETKADPQQVPSFLDFEKRSVVLKVLRTKLW